MSGSHKEFPKKAVGIQLGLAALVGIGFLFADKPAVHAMAEKVTKPIVTAAAKVLAPIGKVDVKAESTASAARTGEEVYAAGCGTCHDNGVAGAPKLDDKSSWETRLSGGFSALVSSAINGKGGMPSRGGNPDNTDSEMQLAIAHMIKQAGIKLVAESTQGAAPAAEMKSKDAPKEEGTPTTLIDKATETIEEVADTAEKATEELAVMAEKVIEEKVETITAVASSVTETMTKADNAAGMKVYKSSCFACHDTGVAGSPKIGDKSAWEARIAAGVDSLYESAIKGKGAMPAKGGNTSISDDDIKAAVDYMTAESK